MSRATICDRIYTRDGGMTAATDEQGHLKARDVSCQIIRFPRRPRLVGRDTTPAEDLDRALARDRPQAYDPYARERLLRQLDAALAHMARTKHGASDPCEGTAPCDIEPEPAA